MIIKRERVRLEQAGAAPSGAERGQAPQRAPAARRHGRASVRAIELEGEIRGLELTCTCGEVTVVELVLDAPAPAAPRENEEAR